MAAGIVIGVWFFPDLVDTLIPVVESVFGGISQDSEGNLHPPMTLVWIIFAKNLQTAVLCFITARITVGILPGLILFLNGVLIGALAVFINQEIGLSYISFAVQLLPHGIFELPALFLACAIGMHGVKVNSWKAMLLPTALLAIAAFMEIYVSPLLM